MPKISNEKKEARRRQIIDAGWRCFQRQGLHATTMQDIIQECGLSAGAVYSYFKAKDELILAAMTTSLGSLSLQLAQVLDEQTGAAPERIVEKAIEAVTSFSVRDGLDMRKIALLGWNEAAYNEAYRLRIRGYYDALLARLGAAVEPWLRSCGKEREVRTVALTMQAVILGSVVQSALLDVEQPFQVWLGSGS